MAPAAAFAEVLDTCLDRTPVRDTTAAGRSPFHVATRSLFWFEGASSVPVPGTGTGSEPARFETAATERRTPDSLLRLVQPVRQPAPRLPRDLSPGQRDALNRMIGLGARLDDAFTLQELRSEFRALARLYHPDRQQAGRRAASAPGSGRFVALRQAYDVLKDAA